MRPAALRPTNSRLTADFDAAVGIALIDARDAQLVLLDQALLDHAGDARRFSSSREAVRYAGLDITVHQPDARRAPGHLFRQGPSALRWALFEAAQCARGPASPDHDCYVHPQRGSAATPPASPSPGSCSSAATTPFANSARRRLREPLFPPSALCLGLSPW